MTGPRIVTTHDFFGSFAAPKTNRGPRGGGDRLLGERPAQGRASLDAQSRLISTDTLNT
jgi:hypothetical protein